MKTLLLCLLALTACEPEPVMLSPMPPKVRFVTVPPKVVPPTPLHPLAQFETKFKDGDRGHNITLLAKTLHDTVLQPGEEFSFNTATGLRSLERGFRDAPAYFVGEVIPSIGGGTCQVSSTLHAAALYAGLEITHRRAHSRPSKYIGPGLDAMVNYPKECEDPEEADPRVCSDLKLRNPFDFPITLRLWTTPGKERVLMVDVMGEKEGPKVTTRWVGTGAPDFKTRYRRVIYWKDERGKRKRLKQSGVPGLNGKLYITAEYADGTKKKRSVGSRYRPTIEVFNVGMDYEIPE